MPVSIDTVTATNAANRDYATPVYAALRADRPFLAASSGFAGTASDGLAQLDADRSLATTYANATHGNVVQTAQLDVRGGRSATLALGFGSTQASAVATAGATAAGNPDRTLDNYQRGWKAYDKRLNEPANGRGLSSAQRKQLARTYYLSANVLKASEDKTFPGAVVASLASPWGQAVQAGDPNNTYFGSYREVFARDLYESFTGLVASGDVATAKDTVRFLFERQQQPDGSMPRNSLVNGKLAPDSFGVQLDEVAYPILMARTVGLTDKAFYLAHIKRAADYVVAHGPAFGNERWEEQAGYSPSTIAAEIAGLAAAGAIADRQRRRRRGADLPRHRRPVPADDQDLDGDDDRPAQHGAVLHPAVQDRRPQRGDHLQPRQRRAGRRPAGRPGRRLPRTATAGRVCPPTIRRSPPR